MSQQQPQQQRNAPLAGRPPWATDEDDNVYDDQPARRLRLEQPKHDPTARDSTYQAWDNYIQPGRDENRASGAGGIGMGFLAGDVDDDSDDDNPPIKKSINPISSGKEKDWPMMSNTLDANMMARPPPAAIVAEPRPSMQIVNERAQVQEIVHPSPRQATGVQRPAAATLRVDVQPAMPIPRPPMPAFIQSPASPAPSLNPHPLNAPSTPITPVFARPSMQQERKVEFSKEAIIRGNSEETLLPRGTTRGEDFWRRFSFVAKDDQTRNHQKSTWLKRYEGGNSRMSRWVWFISVLILLAIGGAIGFGWYMTHNEPPSPPLAVGGSENQAATESSTVASSTTTSGAPPPLIPSPVVEKRSWMAERDTGVHKVPLRHPSRSIKRKYLDVMD